MLRGVTIFIPPIVCNICLKKIKKKIILSTKNIFNYK